MRHSSSQPLLGDHGEAINARMNEKTLESWHSRARQGFHVVFVICDHSSPSHPIHPAPAASYFPLGLERRHSGSGRQAIQRHVHQQSESSRRRGPCRRLKPFPFCAARIVDVHMGIDQTGKNCGIAEVLDFCLPRQLVRSDHLPDSFSFDQHSRRTHSLRCDYPTG